MKRSDAIKFITDILFYGKLAESARSDIRPKCTTEIAEADACAVLKELEKLGMLPPPKKTDTVTSYLVYCYYPEVTGDDKDQLDITNSQLWEPEDE